ncbi:MAG: TetR/AcrR family transcriptional regulator [Promethearchaeota archaeon]
MAKSSEKQTSRQKRKKREQKQRRTDIVQAAERLFITQGFNQTMMDQIAEEAGFSKATIYKYFGSKNDLYLAVAAIAFEKLTQVIEETLKQPDTEFEIKSLASAFNTFIREYSSYAEIIDDVFLRAALAEIIQKEQTNQQLTESEMEFRTQQMKSLGLLTQVITSTMTKIGTQTKLEPQTIAVALSNITTGLLTELIYRERLVNQSKKETEDYLLIIFEILDKGLKNLNREDR